MTDYARLYALRSGPAHLQACERWEELDRLLTAPSFLEAKVQAGMTFQLVADFAAASCISAERPQQRIVALLGGALGRNAHFIAQHVQDYPQALFQCLWNSCWWYDCPDALKHYTPSEAGPTVPPPSTQTGPKLHELLERWRDARRARSPDFPWIRLLRPPAAGPSSRMAAQLTGHLGAVNAVAFAANGQHVLSSGNDGTVRVWDSQSTTELRCIHGHIGTASAVAFSPDGRLIASGSSDGTVRLCAVDNAEQPVSFRGHTSTVKAVAFSSDGRHILSASADRTVRRWNIAERKQTDCFFWHSTDISCVAISFDDQRIASGAQDGQLVVWDGKSIRRLRGHRSGVACVAFSPDGWRLVSGSWDGTIRLWDCDSGAELKCLRGHGYWVSGVSFFARGHRVASCAHDATVRVWDASSRAELTCFRGHSGAVNVIAVSPDERRLVSGAAEGKVCLWTLEGPSGGVLAPAHSSLVTRIAFSADGRWIVTGSVDGDLSLSDATTGEKLREFLGHNGAVRFVAFSPDGGRIISVAEDSTLRVWSVADGREINCLDNRYNETHRLTFSRDGRHIIRMGRYHDEVWDIIKGVKLFDGRPAVFSPDGQHVICGASGSIDFRDASTGRTLKSLPGFTSHVECLDVSPDGRRLVGVFRLSSVVHLWDIPSGGLLTDVATGSEPLDTGCGETGVPELLDPVLSEPVRNFHFDGGRPEDVRISADGRWVLATDEITSYDFALNHVLYSGKTKTIVWDAETGEKAATIVNKKGLARFTTDSKRVVFIDDSGYRLWSITDGRWLVRVAGRPDVASHSREAAPFSHVVFWQGEYGAVVNTESGAVAAWIPHRLDPVALHPSITGWAGAVGNHIEIAVSEKG